MWLNLFSISDDTLCLAILIWNLRPFRLVEAANLHLPFIMKTYLYLGKYAFTRCSITFAESTQIIVLLSLELKQII